MEKLIEILRDINEDVDYENETHLIDDGILSSLSILVLVSEIENEFDVEVSPTDLIPENFNSAASLMMMINQLKEK